MVKPISVAVLSAIIGGLAGSVVTVITQRIQEALRIWRLSRNLLLRPETNDLTTRVRVDNRWVQTVEDAIGYISLDFDPETDVLEGLAFIGPTHRIKLWEDRLCWALAASNDPNPFRTSIFPCEKQALDLVRVHSNRIEIPSEQGWADQNTGKKSRVFLTKKRYTGSLQIVAKNTLRRQFSLVIDPTNAANPVTLTEQDFIRFSTLLFALLLRRNLPGDDGAK